MMRDCYYYFVQVPLFLLVDGRDKFGNGTHAAKSNPAKRKKKTFMVEIKNQGGRKQIIIFSFCFFLGAFNVGMVIVISN